MCSKAFYRSFLSLHRLLLRRLKFAHGTNLKLQKCPSLDSLGTSYTRHHLVFDLEGGLLRSTTTFPYFMLVALEAGSFLRGLALLLLYPLICCLSHDMGIRVMTMVAFCGVRVKGFRLGRAVLPKHFLEEVGLEAFEVFGKFNTRICFSGMPRVMVEGFLKEYLGVEVVVGREIREFGGYFTGLMEDQGKMALPEVKREVELHAKQSGKNGVVGFGGLQALSAYDIFSTCKEVYLVSEADKRKWQSLPRSRYPKPLIFHDGRIALRPTPLKSLSLFLWLPLSVPLAITRAIAFLLLPRYLHIPILACLGMVSRKIIKNSQYNEQTCTDAEITRQVADTDNCFKGHVYVCNHRTLFDPLYISGALGRDVIATTYSVSRVAEFLSPIKTIRLTRNKEVDRKKMETLLSEGEIVVCPEGTTCREPYLLRFSPLFTELNRVITPVALTSHVGMFYGTTASGKKYLDPLYFVMNPSAHYTVEILDKVDTSNGDNLGKQWRNGYYEVANYVQSKIGKALGFECTKLTRRDKYLMLADNEGIVEAVSNER
ncbi:hypothetical protein LUZ62_046642 [Rhynchospora pubera]|uniref:Phospholipid/glycerol acyltransferase domain-containing protein n=1 Tax=Rhynchospora pubera TaxID=906938 RepID=A0AAV8FVC8_9POAL|nr:hypothetical protein LUZ62_046642 [Rhynchospora pubera]